MENIDLLVKLFGEYNTNIPYQLHKIQMIEKPKIDSKNWYELFNYISTQNYIIIIFQPTIQVSFASGDLLAYLCQYVYTNMYVYVILYFVLVLSLRKVIKMWIETEMSYVSEYVMQNLIAISAQSL